MILRTKCFLFLIIFFLCSNLRAQQNIIFKDNFENYENDWKLIKTNEFIVRQEEGKLFISKANENKINNGCLWYKKTINGFNTEKSFTIEFDAKSINSEFAKVLFDFTWGRMQEFDGVTKTLIYQLDFGINRVRLGKFQLGKGWKYYSWSDEIPNVSISEFNIERGVFNSFAIIQNENLLTVKINNAVVYQMTIEPQVGSEIGFQQCLKSEWELDNVVIKQ